MAPHCPKSKIKLFYKGMGVRSIPKSTAWNLFVDQKDSRPKRRWFAKFLWTEQNMENWNFNASLIQAEASRQLNEVIWKWQSHSFWAFLQHSIKLQILSRDKFSLSLFFVKNCFLENWKKNPGRKKFPILGARWAYWRPLEAVIESMQIRRKTPNI